MVTFENSPMTGLTFQKRGQSASSQCYWRSPNFANVKSLFAAEKQQTKENKTETYFNKMTHCIEHTYPKLILDILTNYRNV